MQVGQCEESQERERESEERSEKREERESQRRKKRHVGWKGGKVAKCTVVFTMIRGEGRKVGLIERGARSLQARSVVKKVKAFFNDFEVKSIKNSRSTFGNSISKKSQRLVFFAFCNEKWKELTLMGKFVQGLWCWDRHLFADCVETHICKFETYICARVEISQCTFFLWTEIYKQIETDRHRQAQADN